MSLAKLLWFLFGLFVGTLFGVLMMACLQIGRIHEEKDGVRSDADERL